MAGLESRDGPKELATGLDALMYFFIHIGISCEKKDRLILTSGIS